MCSDADAWYTCIIPLLWIELIPKTTAAQQDKSHKCPVSHATVWWGKKRRFGPQNLRLWGQIIRPNGSHWNQKGHRSQMAVYKRRWLSLPYGLLCNQCQSNTIDSRRTAAVQLSASRGQERGSRRQGRGRWCIYEEGVLSHVLISH